MNYVYCDAGTKNNGVKGKQKTIVVVTDRNGNVIIKKRIGDYSINEGELTGIVYAIQTGADTIFTDSRIARSWVTKGWGKYHEKSLRKGKLTERHKKMITVAHDIWLVSGSPDVVWISRDENKAGHRIEAIREGEEMRLDIHV